MLKALQTIYHFFIFLDWLPTIVQKMEEQHRSFMEEIRAENHLLRSQIIAFLRNPQAISSELDAQVIDIIMPSQPSELPVDTASDMVHVNSQLKDDSTMRARHVSRIPKFLI